MKTNGLIAIVLTATMTAGTAWCDDEGGEGKERKQGREHFRKRSHRPPAEMMIGRLVQNARFIKEAGISEEQVGTFREKMKSMGEKQKELHGKMKVAAEKQVNLLKAEKVDENAVMDAVEETGAIRTEIAKLRVKRLLAVKETFSEEQIEKMRNTMKQMRERRREHRRNRDKEDLKNRRRNREGKGELDPPPAW